MQDFSHQEYHSIMVPYLGIIPLQGPVASVGRRFAGVQCDAWKAQGGRSLGKDGILGGSSRLAGSVLGVPHIITSILLGGGFMFFSPLLGEMI